MKVLVIFTGGTIGSSVTDGVADVNENSARQLICQYPHIDFVCREPFAILSENSTIDTIEKLCNYMLSIDYSDFDGVIVTHGSDTLGYTSAALALALSWINIPVMITAADYVLRCEKSNGRANFCGCIDFIKEFSDNRHNFSGVYTVWKNTGEKVKVHLADRMEQANFDDMFRSFGGEEFGIMENGCFVKNENIPNRIENKIFAENLKGKKVRLSKNIIMLTSYVGADFDCISVKDKDAVLVQTYHSGTVCTKGDNTSFVKFADRCKAHNTDVFLFSLKKRDYVYRSVHEMDSSGINPIFDMGECEALMSLVFKYGEYSDN